MAHTSQSDRVSDLLRLRNLPDDAELASLMPAIERVLRARHAREPDPARERRRTVSRLQAIAARYRAAHPQVSAEIDELARLLGNAGI